MHERKEVRQVIFSNMVITFKVIAEEMRDLGLRYEDPETEVRHGNGKSMEALLMESRNLKAFC